MNCPGSPCRYFPMFLLAVVAMLGGVVPAHGQGRRSRTSCSSCPTITGYGDLGPYGGGEGRGMPTPNIDRLAAEGMTFFSFYAQPSCTPGRAAMQTGRIPNRSGMTTVAFQGQGGGLPKAEWTLGSVLKTAGYRTYFTGKWHLGEADYALPNAQGYDVMEHCFLYHCNAYTYGDPTWFPDMDPKLREMFDRVTKGSLSGLAGQPAKQDWKVNGRIRRHAGQGRRRHSVPGQVRRGVRYQVPGRCRQAPRPAVLHQHQLHEGPPAEPPGARVRAQVALQDEVRRFGGRTGRAHRPRHGQAARAGLGQEHARVLHDGQRRLAGRLSRRRVHAVPRHEGHGPRGRQPRAGNRLLAREDQGRRTQPRHCRRTRPDGHVRFRGGREAAGEGPRRPADHLRQLRHVARAAGHRQVCPQGVVLLHRERTDARGGPRRAITRPSSTCAATTGRRPAVWRSIPISAGRARKSTSPRCRRSSTCGRTRRSATTSS